MTQNKTFKNVHITLLVMYNYFCFSVFPFNTYLHYMFVFLVFFALFLL